jgi:phosphate:Na+ symporter
VNPAEILTLTVLQKTGATGTTDLDGWTLAMGLVGGLALFLFGMEMMADSLKAVAGDKMKAILAKLTTNRLMGVVTGTFVTAVIQSSSVTTVLVVGFISAGLMSLSQSMGVILGADIGTTITAQIIAFKVTKIALLMIAGGFGMTFISKNEKTKLYGAGLLGLGLVFFGMTVMGDAMKPLRSYQPFLNWMAAMENPLLGILAGTVFTGLVQSSSATTGVVIVMASQGFISLEAGIALIFGANIGTCVTALLASIGRPREAVRAAVVHIIFKVVGVLMWFFLIDQLAWMVTAVSPVADGLAGVDKMAAETPRQIANAHTIFNVVNCLVFLPFTTQFARAVEWLVPDRSLEEEELIQAKYLDEDLLVTPSLALDRCRLEILHMGDQARAMMKVVLPAVLTGSAEDLQAVEDMDDRVDALYGQIVHYLGEISGTRLTHEQSEEMVRLMAAANGLETIGDTIETNLVGRGRARLEAGLTISPATTAVIEAFHATVARALDMALVAVTQRNAEVARMVVKMKGEINDLADSAALHEARRLVAEEPNRILAYSIEVDILENLKRIYYFSKRMARYSVPGEEFKASMD